MTNGEKVQIVQMRKRGLGYAEIARSLGMSVNTVKSYCHRNGLKGDVRTSIAVSENVCRQCGSTLHRTPGRKRKQFCSDVCRLCWWHGHREMSRNARTVVCASCGKVFVTDRMQKYCSHACYIRTRFGGAHGNEAHTGAV